MTGCESIPASIDGPMEAQAPASQPEGSDHVGTDDGVGRLLASATDHTSSLAKRSLCRHTPEVGAVCEKDACTVLCGGRAVKRTSLPLRWGSFSEGSPCCNCSRPL